MTDEEIERFALVLKECARIRALIAREEAALSNGEHDDGIPIAAAPPEQRPPVLTRVTDARADYKRRSHPRNATPATRGSLQATGVLAGEPRDLRSTTDRAPLLARRARLYARGPRRRAVVPPRGHNGALQTLRRLQQGHREAARRQRTLRRTLPAASGASARLG